MFTARKVITFLVLLLHVAQQVQPSAACPKQCKCTNTNVICSSRGLTSVPDGIPPNTTILDLSGNTFLILDTAFNLTELQLLNLDKCGIKELLPNLFKGLANLRALYLEGNRIETLKRDTFSGITFVHVRGSVGCLGYRKGCMLDLRKNPIGSINTGAFRSTLRPSIILGGEPNSTLTIENRAFESLKEASIVIENVADLVFKAFAFDGCSEPHLIRILNSGMAMLYNFAFSGIDRIEEFEIRNCTIGEFPNGLFHKTSFHGELNRLSILWSNIMTEIPYMAFYGIGVRSISIAYNTMPAFGNFVFFGMKFYSLEIAHTHQESLRMELNGIKGASGGVSIRNNSFSGIDKTHSLVAVTSTDCISSIIIKI
ncbi:insulin-like growth factor-binding protein complex acid labile subunit [Lineus longissimus]|uniref:insulin-like growth factor-binding protein complex acid labile subunit n=1 Tax=Lineus longissimus TaxID=88925 RepID=UPI00315D38E6